ncbi:MAG: rod shape-determining protein MreC [Candidatus Cloacimonas sp.]|jgi:rod shape-determining protein MreC|nr:rod shape-determining protein MreC [Candidatus Cloacimonas sp.]
MIRKNLVPAILILLSLLMLIGSKEARISKAMIVGNTVFFPFMHSLRAIETTQELKQEVFSLRKKLAETTLAKLSLQNALKQYSEALAITFDTGDTQFELAEVIGYSGQYQERNLIVDKGLSSGVQLGSAVISANGIVGKIILVNADHSVILPFSNPKFQVPVMDARTGVQGILDADITGTISMNLVKLGSEIVVGDTIVTSNLSRLYPKSYPVGEIKRIRESQDNLFISADITPFALVENLEHVFILKKGGKN